jgi:hypothetical protein
MLKKIPTFAYWVLLAMVVVAVPLACSSSSSDSTDAHSESAASDATNPG